MDHFTYKNGRLFAEDVAIEDIAKQVGTPFYCYSSATIERHYNVFDKALSGTDALICYAMKANSNSAVLRTLAKLGAGADVVSEGELRQALNAGIPASKIVYSGVGKKASELKFAISNNILQINVESEPELEALNQIAEKLEKKANVAFRVNPDVDARTHAKISTGKSEHKFGIEWNRAKNIYLKASKMAHVNIVGIDVHIGSQLTKLAPFKAAFAKVKELIAELEKEGIKIENIDLGGGLGIPYEKTGSSDFIPPSPDEYGQMIKEIIGGLGRIILEPGRLIAGNAGILVMEVIYVKNATEKNFVIADGAMNDLMRPSLYGAKHEIIPVIEASGEANFKTDVVGPVCETGDVFVKDIELPESVKKGSLLAICSAGAYGAVMSSTYNSRPLIPEVMVKDDKFAVIRRRPDYKEMTRLEQKPDWL